VESATAAVFVDSVIEQAWREEQVQKWISKVYFIASLIAWSEVLSRSASHRELLQIPGCHESYATVPLTASKSCPNIHMAVHHPTTVDHTAIEPPQSTRVPRKKRMWRRVKRFFTRTLFSCISSSTK
jgi:hypothetical protein